MITKGVQGATAMSFYRTIWIVLIGLIDKFVGVAYVLDHIVPFHMFAAVTYIILMIMFLPVIAREPIPTTLINGMIMFVIEYVQVWVFGLRYYTYILGV